MTYTEKLRDPKWQKIRLQVFERDNFTCRLCEDKETTLHVHHEYYSKVDPWEYPISSLKTLCSHCHLYIERIKIRPDIITIKTYKRFSSNGVLFILGFCKENDANIVLFTTYENDEINILFSAGDNFLRTLLDKFNLFKKENV